MRDKRELKHLLKEYHKGTIDKYGLKRLESWLERVDNKASDIDLTDERQAVMLQNIKRAIAPVKKRRHRMVDFGSPYGQTAIAASVSILVLITILLIRNNQVSTKGFDFVTVATGKGEVRKITLPDSSTVWLNAMTSLAYNRNFQEARTIRLDGEAVFQVTHDPSHPFQVQTPDSVETTVLGTQFNVRSYPMLGETRITVLSGRVKVRRMNQLNSENLIKDDAVCFERSTKLLTKIHNSGDAAAGWRNGEWKISGKGIASLNALLYSQFGIRVISQKKFGDVHVNANFNTSQTAEEIISSYCMLGDCNYRWVNATTVEFY